MSESSTTNLLLERAIEGDPHAFARLFATYEEALRQRLQRRIENGLSRRFDVSDVIQETRLAAFQRLPDFERRRPMPLSIWIYKTAIRQLADLRRFHRDVAKRAVSREQSGHSKSTTHAGHWVIARQLTPSSIVSLEEETRRVRQALDEIPEEDREILLLRYVEQFSNREIALLLDLSDAAASRRHGMALLRLRRLLRKLYPETGSP